MLADTPRLASTANAATAATGAQTAQYRNVTTFILSIPPRTAGGSEAGSVAVDDTNQATFANANSASVAKLIPSEIGPHFYSSAGESFVMQRGSSNVEGEQTGSESITGGLTTAGASAIIGVAGFTVGPVIGIFNAGRRDGAVSQYTAALRNIGACTIQASHMQHAVADLSDSMVSKWMHSTIWRASLPETILFY